MKNRTRGIGVGTISLIMIFSVLCLTIFAMLTLSTANAEKALADRSSAFVRGYYEADSAATKIRAQILESYKNGLTPHHIDGVEIEFIESPGDDTYVSYECVVNDVQNLLVALKLDDTGDTVLTWRITYSSDWAFDDSLTLLDPDMLDLFL